jgi:hypothetical protein
MVNRSRRRFTSCGPALINRVKTCGPEMNLLAVGASLVPTALAGSSPLTPPGLTYPRREMRCCIPQAP